MPTPTNKQATAPALASLVLDLMDLAETDFDRLLVIQPHAVSHSASRLRINRRDDGRSYEAFVSMTYDHFTLTAYGTSAIINRHLVTPALVHALLCVLTAHAVT